MRNGIVGLDLTAGTEFAAPTSGVLLGRGQGGDVTLRLFRLTGTRIALAARVLPAQLIAVRAMAAGTAVHVVTSRPPLWQPLLRDAGTSAVVPAVEALPRASGPALLIDDRPAEARTPIDVRPWQCRIDVRTQWTPSELSGFTRSDIAIFGAVPAETAAAIASTFGVRRNAAEPLCRLDSNSFGMLRRGQVDYVSLNPTPAEGQVLEQARGIGSAPPALAR